MELLKSNECKTIIDEYNKVKYKPVCLFIYSTFETLHPHERCKIYSICEGEVLQNKDKGFILLSKQNNSQEVIFCDACECSPCDCNWGN